MKIIGINQFTADLNFQIQDEEDIAQKWKNFYTFDET